MKITILDAIVINLSIISVFMDIFLKVTRIFCLVLVVILLSLVVGLSILAKNPISLSNDTIQRLIQYYDHKLTTESNGAELKFIDLKLQIIAPNLKIINQQQHFIQLNNINFTLKVHNLDSSFSSQISKTELLSLIYLSNNPDLQKEIDQYVAKNHIYFDGFINLDFSFLSLKQAKLNLISNNGFHDPKSTKLTRIDLKKFTIDLSYSMDKLIVENFNLEYESNIKASLQGDFIFNSEGLSLAEFQANIVNLPVDYLSGLWPRFLAPGVQTWVTDNITQGIIKNAQGNFKLTAEDLKSSLPSKDSIDAKIEVDGANLSYLKGYSPISQINAIVKFDGQALYVNASKALLLNSELINLELILPFNDFILSIKTNIDGKINQFNEFIPELVYQRLLSNKIDFKKIKGGLSSTLALSVPIFDPFKLEALKLDINANLSDVVLDQYKLIKFKQGNLKISNDQDKIMVKVEAAKNFSFNLIKYHKFERQDENQLNINTKFYLEDQISLKDKLIIDKGIIGVNATLNEGKWQLDLDLKEAEVTLVPLSINKPIFTALNFSCVGSFNEKQITGEDCNLKGVDYAGKILFIYSFLDDQITNFSLNNGKILTNEFNIQIVSDKNLSNYTLNGKFLDLSKFDIKNFSSSDEKKNNYKLVFKVDNLILKNEIRLNDISGKIVQIDNNPIDIDLKAFANNYQLTIVKMKKNNQNGYLLHSNSASTFSRAFGIYNNIKRGEVLIEAYPKKTDGKVAYYGNIVIKNFAFSNTSVLTKIILGVMSPFNSPKAVMQALEGGSLKSESFTANLEYNKGVLTLKNGLVQGPSYNIRVNGTVNNNTRILNIKGMYIPSVYGLNSLISFIPFIGELLSGGKKSAFIAANFSVKGSFDNPDVWLNPLSVFTPGFIRNIFN